MYVALVLEKDLMGNTSNLTKLALEKRAISLNPLKWLSGYGRNINRFLINPIKEKGLLRGVGDYVGRQYLPVKHTTGLARNIEDLGFELKNVKNTIKALKESGKASADDLSKLMTRSDEIAQEIANKTLRMNALTSPSGYTNLAGKAFGRGSNLGTRAKAISELGKAGLHYTGQGANTAFMWGFPAYGAYEAITAPEGQRAEALGRLAGDVAGFTTLGPVGLLPVVAGTPYFSDAGAAIGKRLGEYISPTEPKSYYRQMTDSVKNIFTGGPEEVKPPPTSILKRYGPAVVRGTLGKATNLGYSPSNLNAVARSYQPQMRAHYTNQYVR